MFSNLKALAIPEGDVKKIECNGSVLWEFVEVETYKNWARHSINADGSIYNNGQGYKVGYRVRSGGAEGQESTTVCTGFIPLKRGQTLRIYPAFTGGNTDNTINFSDASFTNLGQVTDVGSYYGICNSSYKTSVINGVSTLTLGNNHNSNIAYVRVGHNTSATSNGADLIITVDEEIS